MDSLIAAAARALAAGDALGALKRVALRDDPPALALHGIAMAQLGDLPRARDLFKRAARGFGTHEARARARCVVADAEVALALRELDASPRALMQAIAGYFMAWLYARWGSYQPLFLMGAVSLVCASSLIAASRAGTFRTLATEKTS